MNYRYLLITLLILTSTISCNSGDNHYSFNSDSFDESIVSLNVNYIPGQDDYLIGNDAVVYEAILGEFDNYLSNAKIIENKNERMVALAKAEASLLESSVLLPLSYGNSNYCLSRILPHTYYTYNDDYAFSYKDVLLIDKLIDNSLNEKIESIYSLNNDNEEFLNELKTLIANNNYKLDKQLNVYFENDYVNCFPYENMSFSSKIVLRQLFDGLVEYDIYGNIKCNLADYYEINEDKVTFTLKDDIYWYKDGQIYDKITANDFYNSYKYLLDNGKPCEYIINSDKYIKGIIDYKDVGIKVVDDKTIQYSINGNIECFFDYLCSLQSVPLHKDYIDDKSTWISSGPFYVSDFNSDKVILLKNQSYPSKDKISLEKISFSLEYLPNEKTIDKVINNHYSFMSFTNNQKLINNVIDRNLANNLVIFKPNGNTYFSTFNLDRKDYILNEVRSNSIKNESQQINSWYAIQNKNFRKAIFHAINKRYFLDSFSDNQIIKNIFTEYNHSYLHEDVTYNNKFINKGKSYGDIVQEFMSYDISDNSNSTYDAKIANEYFDLFKKETNINETIVLDLLYIKSIKTSNTQANFIKYNIEKAFNGKVKINLLNTDNQISYYRAISNGSYDLLINYGWKIDDNSIYNNLSSFSRGGSNVVLLGLKQN